MRIENRQLKDFISDSEMVKKEDLELAFNEAENQKKKLGDVLIEKKFIDEIKRGDYVVTVGGAHGHIAELEGDTFILEVEKGGRIRFNKSAISLESSKLANKK